MNTFSIGVNYWDSASGTDMWRNWQPEVVKADLKALRENGVRVLRVFPNWRDFQPVMTLYKYRMQPKMYCDYNEEEIRDPYFLDPEMIRRFRTFAGFAEENGMELIVSLVTGWMSGRMFVPRTLDGKNVMKDAEALRLTEKYVRGLVHYLKDLKNIIAWDLGNECNCMGELSSRDEAAVWVSLVHHTIRCEDPLRPIGSGMHGLDCKSDSIWNIEDQSVLDFMTTHPYPSPTIYNDVEPYDRLRGSLMPTAQTVYYSDISGRPCMIQEQGTFSQILGNDEMAGDFLHINLLSSWANGSSGYLYWCGMEHLRLKNAPYNWSAMERQLGLVDENRNPKPVAKAMKELSDVLPKIPRPDQWDYDAVCILPAGSDKLKNAEAVYALSMEAGFRVRFNNEKAIDEAPFYLLPSIEGDQYLKNSDLFDLLDRVEKGASLYISFGNTYFSEFTRILGLKSNGVYKYGEPHTAHFSFGDLPYTTGKDYLWEAAGAEVLAEDETGNVIFAKQKYGKGVIYVLGFALESLVIRTKDGLSPEESAPYYKIYEQMFRRKDPVAAVDDPYIGVTTGKLPDGSIIAAFMNYAGKDRPYAPVFRDGMQAELLYGDCEVLKKSSGAIFRLREKK